MKKTLIIIMTIIFVIIAIIYIKYLGFKATKTEIKQNNLNYEVYLNKEVYGNEIATLINKATDNNEKNKVLKDERGFYIPNDENSIKIQITTIDLDKEVTYDMESFYNNGMEKFYIF